MLSGGRPSITVAEQVPYVEWLRVWGEPYGLWAPGIQWQEVGASLVVEPIVLDDDRLRLRLKPAFSHFTDRERRITEVHQLTTEVVVEEGEEIDLGGVPFRDEQFKERFFLGLGEAGSVQARRDPREGRGRVGPPLLSLLSLGPFVRCLTNKAIEPRTPFPSNGGLAMSVRHHVRVAVRLLSVSVAFVALFALPAAAQVCTNGSLTDCNPGGTTLNPAAAFVDPTPPGGFQQCAGFRNTALDDVGDGWEQNCAPFRAGPLFLRIYNDVTGALIAGARLTGPDGPCFRNDDSTYDTDLLEGDGFLDQSPDTTCDGVRTTGVTLGFTSPTFCGCSFAACNDIFTANAANNQILYVDFGRTGSDEAVYGPPGPKDTCTLTSSVTTLRIGIYAPAQVPALPAPAIAALGLLLFAGAGLVLRRRRSIDFTV